MAATIRDVARLAGVGLGTVSRVLNDSPLVSPATRTRVLDAIAELRYSPSQIARSFSSGKTLTVSVIAPFFTRPSVVERLRGIESALHANGYSLVVFNVETSARRDACLHDVSRHDRSDGALIISLTPRAGEVQLLRDAGVPVGLIDTSAEGMYGVCIDDIYGGELAVRHLLDRGHRRIGFLGDSEAEVQDFNFTSSRHRQLGYLKALDAADATLRPEYQRYGVHGRSEARLLARELLQLPEPPTAIFAASDTQAMGVLEASRDLQLRVPEDLSVIGFDDIDVAEYLGLTTVRQPLFMSGQRGVEILLGLIGGEPPDPPSQVLPIELVARGTTAPM
ncbi:LacI family transcriptional regulator [Oscillochloris sp. ZM17-4]|uniref:LacI family DNA-binding transcriptional regulator n=1 Tax=Oscillochloris sp. ZM17-4 TaxID=2866714 RepID=UPI001C72E65A|nr:LacI family DNA-binding transcriptional regulator [Oscillochloris sp. ZM17-4]MBX0330960.1 LacI family transcriptional regulator [Oscillochloris sp. ZM17-4]